MMLMHLQETEEKREKTFLVIFLEKMERLFDIFFSTQCLKYSKSQD